VAAAEGAARRAISGDFQSNFPKGFSVKLFP
jgi:hypothetical protein